MIEKTTPLNGHVAVVSSLGERLRAARESRELSMQDVVSALRAPLRIVEAMEDDDFAALGAPVYARGYLVSYAKLVGVPVIAVDTALRHLAEPMPPLHSASRVSHGRYLMDRFARRAASIVLTASIVVPVVWLATEQRLPVQPVGLRSLDLAVTPSDGAPAAIQADSGTDFGPPASLAGRGPGVVLSGAAEPASAIHVDDQPVVASFAPFLGARSVAQDVQGAASDIPTTGWHLHFEGDSWVEIVDRDGRRLDFGVIRAGSERHYPADRLARVALGNAGVVTVRRNGEVVSISAFKRANVARFAVSSGGELTPAGG